MTTFLLFLGLLALAFALSAPWAPKKPRSISNEQLRRRHGEINRKHLGHHGAVLPQALYCIGALALAHAVVFALHFIVITIMGMQEPRW